MADAAPLVDAPRSKYYPNRRYRLPPGPGRPKGAKDRWRQDAKWQIDEIFRMCGSVEGATKWAKKHPDIFYPLYFKCRVPKPLELDDEDSNITIIIRRVGDDPQPQQPKQLNAPSIEAPHTSSEQAGVLEENESACASQPVEGPGKYFARSDKGHSVNSPNGAKGDTTCKQK